MLKLNLKMKIGLMVAPCMIILSLFVGITISGFVKASFKDDAKNDNEKKHFYIETFLDQKLPGTYTSDGVQLFKGNVDVTTASDELRNIAKKTDAVMTLFAYDTRVFTTIADSTGGSILGTKIDPEILTYLKNNKTTFSGTSIVDGQEFYGSYIPIINNFDQFVGVFYLGAHIESLFAIAQSIETYIIVIMLIGTIVITTLLLLVLGKIIQPIKTVSNFLKNLSSGTGDLTQRLHLKQKDEIGELAEYFNKFAEYLTSAITSIKQVSAVSQNGGLVLADNTGEVSAGMEEMSATINAIEQKIQLYQTKLHDSKLVLQKIKTSAQFELAEVSNQAAAVSQSSAAIEQMIANVQSISQNAEEKWHVAEDLNKMASVGIKQMHTSLEMLSTI
jgi:methyl-accepting chemotaxis protein